MDDEQYLARAGMQNVIRVIAAGVESLMLSRPRMALDTLWESSPWPGPISFSLVRFGPSVARDNVRMPRFPFNIRFRMGERGLALLHDIGAGAWMRIDERIEPVSQSEAERLAGSFFSRPYTVPRVSDVAIEKAKEILANEQPDIE